MAVNLRIWRPRFSRLSAYPDRNPRILTIKCQPTADLKRDITIVIVTHNMEQAQRCADKVAFFYLGEMIEAGSTGQMFDAPRQRRTQDYMAGIFG